MAEVLRELIARVVLRVDESTLKRLDTGLTAVKTHLATVQAKAAEGVSVAVDVNATAAQQSLSAVNASLSELGTSVNTEPLKAQLETASVSADALHADIAKLKTVDPSSPQLVALDKQLDAVEAEAVQASVALNKLSGSLVKVDKAGSPLPGMFGKVRAGLGALGLAIGAAGLIGFVGQTLEAAGAVEDLADRLGMGTDEVQVWSAFAKKAGADNEALSTSVKGLANAMQGAANGGKEQKAAFDALGISTDTWKKGLPPLTDTLALVGGKLAELDNEGQRVALTQKLLSEGGLKLGPAFKGGTAAVQDQLTKLKELSVVYSEDFVKSAGEAGDELDMFYAQFRGLGSEVVLTFLPALRGAVRELTPLIRGFREGFSNSKIFTGGLVAAGAAGLTSFGGMSGIFARIGPALGRMAALAAPFLRGFLKFAAIALILDDFFVMLNGGKSVLGELLGRFELGRTILETFQNTFKAFKGTVMVAWGALSGNKDALNKGMSLLNEYTQWMDNILGNIKFAWNQLWNVDMPALLTSGLTSIDTFFRETFGGIYTFLVEWGGKIAGAIGAIWDGMIAGLKDALKFGGDLLSKLPGFGGSDTPESETAPPGAPANALAAGSPSAPVLAGTGPTSSVTVNNDYTFETTIGGSSSKEVVAAVQKAETNHRAVIKDNRKTVRHAVGAQR